jgi:MYXO-CTERM domain-containing protein
MFTKSFLGAAVTAMILGLAGRAGAQTCAADKDCPQGLACTATTVVTPVGPSCKPGTDCPPPPDASPATSVVMSCEPRNCNADVDCGDGMVCYSWTSTSCSGGSATTPACAPNTPCDAAPPKAMDEQCTTTTIKKCAFRWQVPCNKDAECGAGFTCKPSVSGGCAKGGGVAVGGGTTGSSGSGGSAGTAGSGGSAPNPVPPVPPDAPNDAGADMCNITSTYPGSCQLTISSCTADADCPGGWKCQEAPGNVVGMDAKPPVPGAPPAPPASDASAPAAKVCISPYGGYGGGPLRGGTDETKGGLPPQTPTDGTSHAGADAGASPSPSGGGTVTTPASSKSSGCSVGSGGQASGLGALLVIALALRIRRRRR